MSIRVLRLRLFPGLALVLAMTLMGRIAHASFHNWKIVEFYSNADGSVQYIEFFTTSGTETAVGGHTLTATSTVDGSPAMQSFTLPAGSLSNTANHRLLFATADYNTIAPPAADANYTIPDGFINSAATRVVLNFVGAGSVTFDGTVPIDGQTAVHFTTAGVSSLAVGSPQNFTGGTCALVCPTAGDCTELGGCGECAADTHCNDGNACTDDACDEENLDCTATNNDAPCSDPNFCSTGDACSGGSCQPGAGSPCTVDQVCDEANNQCDECDEAGDCNDLLFCTGTETCVAPGVCADRVSPCTGGDICDEDNNQCDECDGANDCGDDGNVCTDVECDIPPGVCDYPPNTDPCNDDLFCNGADTCDGGACAHAGSPCGADNCNEGTNSCGDCVGLADCNDANPCTDDACTAGDCVYTDVANDTACTDDGAFCTGPESCQSGACVSDGDPCSDAETCVEEADTCSTSCGNGSIDSGEECDDGDNDDLDGCDGDCLREPGFTCIQDPGPASVCISECGDGVLAEGAEACDDGDAEDEADEDGCDGACAIEDGWGCAANDQGVDVCDPTFGDGLLVGDEACDDGNETDGDGCFEGAVEAGFTCDDAEPSSCDPDVPPFEPADEPAEAGPDVGTPDVSQPDAAGDAAEPAPDAGGSTTSEDEGCCSTAAGTRGPDVAAVLAILGVLVLNRRRRPGRYKA